MSQVLNKIEISTNRFSPVILMCTMFTQGINLPKGYKLEARYVYDYELEYITYSDGSIIIESKNYPVHSGDVVFRKPGQYVQGVMPYTCYVISFDLLGNTGKDPSAYDFTKAQKFQDYYVNPILDSIPAVFHSPYPEKYQKIFDYIFKEYISMNEETGLIMKSYLLQLIYQLYMDTKNPLSAFTVPANPYYGTLKNTLEFIKENYQDKINLELLAAKSRLSPSHFHKMFTKALNITPNKYLTKIRLEKAKELLIKTELSISEIALQCGFENIPYFNYVFKKYLNMSPGEFRKRLSYK